MGSAESLSRHVVGNGEVVVADDSAVLEMTLRDSVGIILYDRGRRLAAACTIAGPGRNLRRFREEVDAGGLALLHELVSRGSSPEDIEMFALGPGSSLDCRGAAGDRPAPGPCARPVLVHSMSESGEARRVEFDVRSGRMVLEEISAGNSPDRDGDGD